MIVLLGLKKLIVSRVSLLLPFLYSCPSSVSIESKRLYISSVCFYRLLSPSIWFSNTVIIVIKF